MSLKLKLAVVGLAGAVAASGGVAVAAKPTPRTPPAAVLKAATTDVPSKERGLEVAPFIQQAADPTTAFKKLSESDQISLVLARGLKAVPRQGAGRKPAASLGAKNSVATGLAGVAVTAGKKTCGDPGTKYICKVPYKKNCDKAYNVFDVYIDLWVKNFHIGEVYTALQWCHNGRKILSSNIVDSETGGYISWLNAHYEKFTKRKRIFYDNFGRQYVAAGIKHHIEIDYKVWHYTMIQCQLTEGGQWSVYYLGSECNLEP